MIHTRNGEGWQRIILCVFVYIIFSFLFFLLNIYSSIADAMCKYENTKSRDRIQCRQVHPRNLEIMFCIFKGSTPKNPSTERNTTTMKGTKLRSLFETKGCGGSDLWYKNVMVDINPDERVSGSCSVR